MIIIKNKSKNSPLFIQRNDITPTKSNTPTGGDIDLGEVEILIDSKLVDYTTNEQTIAIVDEYVDEAKREITSEIEENYTTKDEYNHISNIVTDNYNELVNQDVIQVEAINKLGQHYYDLTNELATLSTTVTDNYNHHTEYIDKANSDIIELDSKVDNNYNTLTDAINSLAQTVGDMNNELEEIIG